MNTLKTEFIAEKAGAPIVVLFGGNPYRRHEVISLIETLGGVTVYGTLNEAEGMSKIQALSKVDLVLIGGRYSEDQRQRIRGYVKENLPTTQITEPGFDYPYSNTSIENAIKEKLGIS